MSSRQSFGQLRTCKRIINSRCASHDPYSQVASSGHSGPLAAHQQVCPLAVLRCGRCNCQCVRALQAAAGDNVCGLSGRRMRTGCSLINAARSRGRTGAMLQQAARRAPPIASCPPCNAFGSFSPALQAQLDRSPAGKATTPAPAAATGHPVCATCCRRSVGGSGRHG